MVGRDDNFMPRTVRSVATPLNDIIVIKANRSVSMRISLIGVKLLWERRGQKGIPSFCDPGLIIFTGPLPTIKTYCSIKYTTIEVYTGHEKNSLKPSHWFRIRLLVSS